MQTAQRFGGVVRDRRANTAGRSRARSRGFTLVELLVVITVLALIGGITMGVMHTAQNAARKSRTKATIAKINQVIMERYQAYTDRTVTMVAADGEILGRNQNTPQSHVNYALAKLEARRDLCRMEMPDRWNDVTDPPVSFNWGKIEEPALQAVYQAHMLSSGAAASKIGEYGPAECLYMIVMLGSPESRVLFKENEIGDKDEDGLPEFKDGWDEPIHFIRWAPGYTPYSKIQQADADNDHDPMDPTRVDVGAYRLIPLIYSAGPDRELDLIVDHSPGVAGYHFDGSPRAFPELGKPQSEHNTDPPYYYADNITNHD